MLEDAENNPVYKDIVPLVQEAISDWDETENLIKKAEQNSGQAVIASINELRYAGRRLVDALPEILNSSKQASQQGHKKIYMCLNEMRQFTRKAKHDAVDTIVYSLLKQYIRLEEEFDRKNLYRFFGERFFDGNNLLCDLQERIASSRQNREKPQDGVLNPQNIPIPEVVFDGDPHHACRQETKDREQIYNEIIKGENSLYVQAVGFVNYIKNSKEFVKGEVEREAREKAEAEKERRSSRFWTVAGWVVAAIIALLTWLVDKNDFLNWIKSLFA